MVSIRLTLPKQPSILPSRGIELGSRILTTKKA